MHTAVYAGIPAANTAMAIATAVLADPDPRPDSPTRPPGVSPIGVFAVIGVPRAGSPARGTPMAPALGWVSPWV